MDQLQAMRAADVDNLKVALPFESIMDQILEPFDWPGTTNWTLVDVRLAESARPIRQEFLFEEPLA